MNPSAAIASLVVQMGCCVLALLAAVVVIVSVVVVDCPGAAVRLAGEKLQVLSAGRPLHAKLTLLESPAFAAIVSFTVPLCPGLSVSELGLELIVKSGGGVVATVMVLDTVFG